MRTINMEKIYEEILSLVEEFINELDDETVNNSAEKRRENEEKAIDKYLEAVRKNNGNYDAEEVQQAREDGRVAREKYQKNQDLRAKRDKRLEKKLADFKERLLNRKPQTAKETQKAESEHGNAMIDQHLRNKLEKSFAVSNECFEEILSLVEEFINELDTETVQAVYDKRRQNSLDADRKLTAALKDPESSEDKINSLTKNALDADAKFSKNVNLVGARNKRHEKALADFKERLLNRKPQKASVTDKAGSDHDNAIIDQHYRSKLEKTFSNECLEEIISLIEGKVIDFQEKRRDKVLNKNAEEFARMARGGELEAVRILPNGEFMGDPHYVGKINKIKKENEEVMGRWKKNG